MYCLRLTEDASKVVMLTYQIAFRVSLEGVLDRIRRSHNIDDDDRQENGDGGTSKGA